MASLESTGLTLEMTSDGTNRELHTVRLKGDYVASICYFSKNNRSGIKQGVWSDIFIHPDLTFWQKSAIELYIKQQTKRFHSLMFGRQT